jgi:hypothetical protein
VAEQMKSERKHFIALSYDTYRAYALVERLSAKLDAAGIPTWFLRRMPGDWYAAWLDQVQQASGVVVVTGGDRTLPDGGLGLEDQFINRRLARHPARVKRVTVPPLHVDNLRPSDDEIKVSPQGAERVGDERAWRSADAHFRDRQRTFDDEVSSWLDALVQQLKEWGAEVLALEPIGALDDPPPVAGDSAEPLSEAGGRPHVVKPMAIDWVREHLSRLQWAGLYFRHDYYVELACRACGSLWKGYPDAPPGRCLRCGYDGSPLET